MAAYFDDAFGGSGSLNGRVSDSGHTWGDIPGGDFDGYAASILVGSGAVRATADAPNYQGFAAVSGLSIPVDGFRVDLTLNLAAFSTLYEVGFYLRNVDGDVVWFGAKNGWDGPGEVFMACNDVYYLHDFGAAGEVTVTFEVAGVNIRFLVGSTEIGTSGFEPSSEAPYSGFEFRIYGNDPVLSRVLIDEGSPPPDPEPTGPFWVAPIGCTPE